MISFSTLFKAINNYSNNKKTNMNNILIIGAHFDDAELGTGGTAAKLVKMGKKVYELTLTENVTDLKT